MTGQNKVHAYIGFSIRSGHVLFGQDALFRERKKIYTVLADKTCSQNTLDALIRFCDGLGTPLVSSGDSVEMLTNRTNCKVIGLTDKKLAEAVLATMDREKYLLLSGGDSN